MESSSSSGLTHGSVVPRFAKRVCFEVLISLHLIVFLNKGSVATAISALRLIIQLTRISHFIVIAQYTSRDITMARGLTTSGLPETA